MKAFVLGLVFALGIGTAAAAKPPKKDLVFIGTVLLIEKDVPTDAIHHFLVTASVDKHLSGEATGPTVEFGIHSPTLLGLEYGGIYEMRATWTPQGYVVDAARRIGARVGAQSKDLLLFGKVTAIKVAETADSLRRWVVSIAVDKVLSGDFPAPTFSFAIHSPAMAGLKAGKSYVVPARWTGNGYQVDQLDLFRRNHSPKPTAGD